MLLCDTLHVSGPEIHCLEQLNQNYDAVEAHSCVDIVVKFTDEQYTSIN